MSSTGVDKDQGEDLGRQLSDHKRTVPTGHQLQLFQEYLVFFDMQLIQTILDSLTDAVERWRGRYLGMRVGFVRGDDAVRDLWGHVRLQSKTLD